MVLVTVYAVLARVCSSLTALTDVARAAQMGGPEGVFRTEQYTLITGMAKGMLMHAVPRPGLATA